MGQDESKPQGRAPRPSPHGSRSAAILNPANAVATHFVIGDIDNDYFTVEHADAISESSHHSNASSTNFQSNSPVNSVRKRSSVSPPPLPHGVKPPPLAIPSSSPTSPFVPNPIDSTASSPDGAVRSHIGRPSSTRHEVTAPLPDPYNSKSCTNASSSSFSLTAPTPGSRVRSNTSQEDSQARVTVFLECMFAALDSDGDGQIDIYDLLKWMENEPYYIKADPKTMCKTIYKRVNLQPDEKVRMNLKEWLAAFKDFKRCELERMAAQLAASNPSHFERSPPRVKPPPNSQQKLDAVAAYRQQASGCHALHANRWRGFQQSQGLDRLSRTSSTGATCASPSVPSSTASPRAFDDAALSSSDSSPSSPLAAQISVSQYPAPLSSRSEQESCSGLRRAQSQSPFDSHSPSPVPSIGDAQPNFGSSVFGSEGAVRGGFGVVCGEVKSSDLPPATAQSANPTANFDQPSPSSSPLGQSRSTRATTRSSHALVCVPEHTELSPNSDSVSPVSPNSPAHSARSISFPLFVSPRAPMLLPDVNPSELSLPTIDGAGAFGSGASYPPFAPVDGVNHSLQVLYHALDQSDKSGACSRDHVISWVSRDLYFRRTENKTLGLEVLTRARALPSASNVTLQEFAGVLEGLEPAVLDLLLANLARSTLKVPAKLQLGRSAKAQSKTAQE